MLADKLLRALQALDRGDLQVHGEGHSTEETKTRLEARIRELDADVLARRAGRSAKSNGFVAGAPNTPAIVTTPLLGQLLARRLAVLVKHPPFELVGPVSDRPVGQRADGRVL